MKHTFSHVVSFESSSTPGHWVDQAALCMHADALMLARHISSNMPNTIVRVEDQMTGQYVNVYFKAGKEIVDIEQEIAA